MLLLMEVVCLRLISAHLSTGTLGPFTLPFFFRRRLLRSFCTAFLELCLKAFYLSDLFELF